MGAFSPYFFILDLQRCSKPYSEEPREAQKHHEMSNAIDCLVSAIHFRHATSQFESVSELRTSCWKTLSKGS